MLEERKYELRKRLRANLEEAAAAGAVHGSRRVVAAFEVLRAEIETRMNRVWLNLHRAVTSAGVAPNGEELAEELKAFLTESSTEVMTDIRSAWVDESRVLRGSPWGGPTLDEELGRAVRKQVVEAELFAMNVTGLTPAAAGPTVINVYAPVGAVQTGASSSAIVDQRIDTESAQALIATFQKIAAIVETIDDAAVRSRVQELTRAASAEAGSQAPDAGKLRRLLGDTAVAIQTLAAAEPARQFLKAVLMPYGIILP
jgi:hypothetical protein